MKTQTKIIYAYCWSNGMIEFGPKVPAGALSIARAMEGWLRHAVASMARISYPSKPGAGDEHPIVPGIPEARQITEPGKQSQAALDALHKFTRQVNERLAANGELIALAPELFQVLEAVHEEMGMRISRAAFDEFSEPLKQKLSAVLEKAKAL